MNLLLKRTPHSDQIAKGIFTNNVLTEESKNIDKAQTTLMQRRGFKTTNFFTSRSFSVASGKMDLDHLAKHRFVDMKRRGSQKKKSHPIHNRILFGHANNIVKRLSFGYTEAVKEKMNLLKNNLAP